MKLKVGDKVEVVSTDEPNRGIPLGTQCIIRYVSTTLVTAAFVSNDNQRSHRGETVSMFHYRFKLVGEIIERLPEYDNEW